MESRGPGPLITRLAGTHDLAACVRLATSHEGGDASFWESAFLGRLERVDAAVFVALRLERVVGYGYVAHQAEARQTDPPLPSGYYLSGVVVREDCRRIGIGLALCDARLAWSAERTTDLWFFTNVTNEASRCMHRRAGFTETIEFTSPDLDGGRGILGRRAVGADSASLR
jgi:ribosomal protein S18 acetylase RimI-like enzyme